MSVGVRVCWCVSLLHYIPLNAFNADRLMGLVDCGGDVIIVCSVDKCDTVISSFRAIKNDNNLYNFRINAGCVISSSSNF